MASRSPAAELSSPRFFQSSYASNITTPVSASRPASASRPRRRRSNGSRRGSASRMRQRGRRHREHHNGELHELLLVQVDDEGDEQERDRDHEFGKMGCVQRSSHASQQGLEGEPGDQKRMCWRTSSTTRRNEKAIGQLWFAASPLPWAAACSLASLAIMTASVGEDLIQKSRNSAS